MWFFGKNRTSVRNVARDDDDESDIFGGELPSFAPEIVKNDEENLFRFDVRESEEDEQEQDAFSNADGDEEESFEEDTDEYEAEEDEEDFANDKEEELDAETEERNPGEVYRYLKEKPYTARRYALCDGGMKMVAPDGNGGIYLFEEYGDYTLASPDATKAFIKVTGITGTFKGETYDTSDLEYILKEKAWPMCVVAKNKEQYKGAVAEGYKPYKSTANGKGILLAKPLSLYRMKDLALKAEITFPTPVVQTDSYIVDVKRSVLEEAEGEKQFKKLLKTVLEALPEQEDRFFKMQVLKVRKNIAVCFPLDGNPKTGDRLSEGIITAVAPAGDGTVLIQIGQDFSAELALEEGGATVGQHRISVEEQG